MGSISGLGRPPEEGNGNPLQYSCLGESYGLGSLQGYSPWGCRVRPDWVTIQTSTQKGASLASPLLISTTTQRERHSLSPLYRWGTELRDIDREVKEVVGLWFMGALFPPLLIPPPSPLCSSRDLGSMLDVLYQFKFKTIPQGFQPTKARKGVKQNNKSCTYIEFWLSKAYVCLFSPHLFLSGILWGRKC